MNPVEHVRPVFELALPFDGPLRRKLAAPVKIALERLLLLRKLNQFYDEVARGDCELPFIERILEALDLSYEITRDDLFRIPKEGPLVVIANHPLGMVDGIVLASIVRAVSARLQATRQFLSEPNHGTVRYTNSRRPLWKI